MPHPEPVDTPDGPTYESRSLANADEEIVDQGLAFDLTTLVTRRGALGALVVGAGTLVLAACAPASSTRATVSATATATATATPTPSASSSAASAPTVSTEIPDETAGPYPGDGSNGPDVLEASGVVRSDIRASTDGQTVAAGIPMTLTLTIVDMASGGMPFAGVAVYVWHCDRDGEYSMYSSGLEDVDYLRGVQVAGADGTVTFTSIFPACYSGRWPHLHFEVYPDVSAITDSANAVATSQVALPQDVCDAAYATAGYERSVSNLAQLSLATDNVFGDDGGANQLATVTGDVSSGYAVSLLVGVDTSTTPTPGNAPPPGR